MSEQKQLNTQFNSSVDYLERDIKIELSSLLNEESILGNDWYLVGQYLTFSPKQLNIIKFNIKFQDKFGELLNIWLQVDGELATIAKLYHACAQAKRNDCLRAIEKQTGKPIIQYGAVSGTVVNPDKDISVHEQNNNNNSTNNTTDDKKNAITALNIVLLSANPVDAEGTVAEVKMIRQVKTNILNALRLQEAAKIVVHDYPACQTTEVVRKLIYHKPVVVLHFFAHSAADGLYLLNEKSEASLVTPFALETLFKAKFAKSVKLVLLIGCLNESVAEKLAEWVPYVIGTTDKITNKQAEDFCGEFYNWLASGKHIDDAFEAAQATFCMSHAQIKKETFKRFTKLQPDHKLGYLS